MSSNSIPRFRRLAVAALAVAALAAVPVPSFAQDEAPPAFTYVAEWTLPRSQWQGYHEWTMKQDKPILERLASEGVLLDWGIYETFVHTDGGNTHGTWWTTASFADMDKVLAALAKAPSHPALVGAGHHDFLLRTASGGRRSGAINGGFLYVNRQVMRPGEGGAWLKMWNAYTKPVYEQLMADGALAGYSVQYEDVHTGPPTVRYIATISTSAAGEDQIEAALRASSGERSEGEREAAAAASNGMTDNGEHRDYFARIIAAWFK